MSKVIEKQVQNNALALDRRMSALVKSHEGCYVLFHDGQTDIVTSLSEAVEQGIEKYGVKTGFVARHISSAPPVLSSLVVL